MLSDIEDVAKLYYSQDMIDYNLYSIISKTIKAKKEWLVCSKIMPRSMYDKYKRYICKACNSHGFTCYVIWDNQPFMARIAASNLLYAVMTGSLPLHYNN